MNKVINKKQNSNSDAMLQEYDFSGGVRGKHYKAYRKGHTVKIHKANGKTVVQHFTLEDGAIMLEPDVQKYFPNSESVNDILRSSISLIPQKGKSVINTKQGIKSD